MYNQLELDTFDTSKTYKDYVPFANYKYYPKLRKEDKEYNGFNVYTFIPQLLPNKNSNKNSNNKSNNVVEKMGNFLTHTNTIDHDVNDSYLDSGITFDESKQNISWPPIFSKSTWNSTFKDSKADRVASTDCNTITDPGEKTQCERLREALS